MADFRFLPQAQAEYFEQVAYYGRIRLDLGLRFADAVADAVRAAAQNPEIGAPRSRNTRRRLVKGFPFAVIYAVRGDEILVVAVADGRRRPDYWASRIR